MHSKIIGLQYLRYRCFPLTMPKNYRQTLNVLRKKLRAHRESSQLTKQEETLKEFSFQEMMADVERIVSDTVMLKPKRQPIKVKTHTEEVDYPYFYVGESYEAPPKVHAKNGQGGRDIHKLQQYTYPIVANLDLHGERLEGLDELLTEFCMYVQSKGVCARIIHGSGLGSKNAVPILKNKVRYWLFEYPEVLAYVEEKNNDGAVLILLKQKGNR